MDKYNKKGWCVLFVAVAAVILFISFSIYINRSTLDESLSQAMQNKGTTMVSYQVYSKTKPLLGGDSIFLVKAANGKQYHVDVDHNQLVISTAEAK